MYVYKYITAYTLLSQYKNLIESEFKSYPTQ